MAQELVLKSASPIQLKEVAVKPVLHLLEQHENHIDVHTNAKEYMWNSSGFVSCEIGVISLSETGTLYDALAEIEARGFSPAYGCELLSLWNIDNDSWQQHKSILALADTRRAYYTFRTGAEIEYFAEERWREILANNKCWRFSRRLWSVKKSTPLIEKNTALAVTKQRNGESFLDNLVVEDNTELQLIRMAQIRARAKFAGGPNADAVMMNSMIVSLLAEISSNLSQIPDMARQLEEMNETVKAGAVLNYNEQVDIYNKLVDIKDIMLNRYKED